MKKIKWMAFMPMLGMMCLIWSFSAHTGDESSGQSLGVVSRIIQVIEQVTDQDWTEEQELNFQEMIHTPIRKAAHMTEYFILEILTAFPFLLYKKRRSWIVKVSFVICFLYACSDELHQLFVPERSCQFTDVLVDCTGVSIGCFLFFLIYGAIHSSVISSQPH